MSKGANHNSGALEGPVSIVGSHAYAGDAHATIRRHVRHIYVHIPFCARICPYCAFYKDLLDSSQTSRFCEAILRDLDQQCASFTLTLETIYFGRATPTALSTSQLQFFPERFYLRFVLSL